MVPKKVSHSEHTPGPPYYCSNSATGFKHFLFRSDRFFFSSRRRHTRCSRDWSSDVCSSDLDALLPTVTDRLTREVLAVEPLRARIIANYGVGFNHIDTASAKARGLVVTNTPDVLTDDTADDAIMLMLMVARRGGEGDRHVRAGAWTGWRPTHMLGTRVSGKTLGLVGLGRIGRAVAHRAHHGFGLRGLFHEP